MKIEPVPLTELLDDAYAAEIAKAAGCDKTDLYLTEPKMRDYNRMLAPPKEGEDAIAKEAFGVKSCVRNGKGEAVLTEEQIYELSSSASARLGNIVGAMAFHVHRVAMNDLGKTLGKLGVELPEEMQLQRQANKKSGSSSSNSASSSG